MIKRYRRRHRLDKGMKGWIDRHSRRNLWRVSSPSFDLDDLIQEGYICYCRCLDMYGHIREQRHFMALLKITFMNHINTLATGKISGYSQTRARFVDIPLSSCAEDDLSLEQLTPVEPEEQTFNLMIQQLPPELKELVYILLSDVGAGPMRDENGVRETTNQWLCRLAGLPSKRCNVEDMLKRHFGLLESKPIPKGNRAYVYAEGKLR